MTSHIDQHRLEAEQLLSSLRQESGNTDKAVCPACGSGAWDTDALNSALFGFCHDCGFDLNTELSFSRTIIPTHVGEDNAGV